jgi:hypothetical protein
MRRMISILALVAIVSGLSGCCLFRPQTVGEEPKALGDMHEVLGAVRDELIKLKNDSATKETVGMTVGKITGTFRVIQVDAKAGKLQLGIVKPVGTGSIEASRQSTMENTIVVEFTPVVTKFEECPASQKDSVGRPCKKGDLVKLPDDRVFMLTRPESAVMQ